MKSTIMVCVAFLVGAIVMSLFTLLEERVAPPAPRPAPAPTRNWDEILNTQNEVRTAFEALRDPSNQGVWNAASERLIASPEQSISLLLPALQEEEIEQSVEASLILTLSEMMRADFELREAVERAAASYSEKAQQRIRQALTNSETQSI